MATVNITQYSSYRWNDVSGGRTPEGSVTIALGSTTVILSQEEWQRIRRDVENASEMSEGAFRLGGSAMPWIPTSKSMRPCMPNPRSRIGGAS